MNDISPEAVLMRVAMVVFAQCLGIVMVIVGIRFIARSGSPPATITWTCWVLLFVLCVVTILLASKYNFLECSKFTILRLFNVTYKWKQYDLPRVDELICYIGIIDAIILSFLIVASGGIAKSVYAPIVPTIPTAVLLFMLKPSQNSGEIYLIICIIIVGIIFSYLLYAFRILCFSKHTNSIYDFWEKSSVKDAHLCVLIITMCCICVVGLESVIEIYKPEGIIEKTITYTDTGK